MASVIGFFLARRWLAWAGLALIVAATYFGWRAVQRGIGARKLADELRARHVEAVEKGNRARVDAGSGSERDRRLQERFRRD